MMTNGALKRIPLLLLAAVVGVAAGGVLMVDAAIHQPPCVKTWSGPSVDNNVDDCTDPKLIQEWLITKAAMILFPVVLGNLFLLACPLVFCARYCCGCCGGHKQRPGSCCCGDAKYDTMPEDERRMNYP